MLCMLVFGGVDSACCLPVLHCCTINQKKNLKEKCPFRLTFVYCLHCSRFRLRVSEKSVSPHTAALYRHLTWISWMRWAGLFLTSDECSEIWWTLLTWQSLWLRTARLRLLQILSDAHQLLWTFLNIVLNRLLTCTDVKSHTSRTSAHFCGHVWLKNSRKACV